MLFRFLDCLHLKIVQTNCTWINLFVFVFCVFFACHFSLLKFSGGEPFAKICKEKNEGCILFLACPGCPNMLHLPTPLQSCNNHDCVNKNFFFPLVKVARVWNIFLGHYVSPIYMYYSHSGHLGTFLIRCEETGQNSTPRLFNL